MTSTLYSDFSVSVVVPAHNEERFIERCISSVLRTGWPSDRLEIVVVDHCSSDATARLAKGAGARVIHEAREKRIGAVRNAGLRSALGHIIACVDADCTVPSSWLHSAIALLVSDQKIGAVGGPCLAPGDGSWVERCLAPTHLPSGVVKPAVALATSSLIVRAELLSQLGHFDETLLSGEDDDLSNRIRERGLILVSATDCHVVHHGYPRSLAELVKKELWHGSNHIDVRSGFDLTLILTLVFLLSSVGVPVLLVAAIVRPSTDTFVSLAAAVALQFSAPLLFAAKRLRQSLRDWRLALPLLAVGYAYFMGHGLGVVANFHRSIATSLRKFA